MSIRELWRASRPRGTTVDWDVTRSVALLITLGALSTQAGAQQLVPTAHPPVPRSLAQVWLVPANQDRAVTSAPLATALRFLDDGDPATAAPLLAAAAQVRSPLSDYAIYYQAVAEQTLGRHETARDGFRALAQRQPAGYLAEAAALGEAEAHEALGDPEKAVAVYERLTALKTAAPDDVLMRLAAAAKAAGEPQKAAEALARVHFEFPMSSSAAAATAEYSALPGVQPLAAGNQRYKLELGRAQRLAGARQWAQARTAFEQLRPHARGDDFELVTLRLAEADHFQRRYRAAADRLQPLLEKASRQGEALYYYAVSIRALGRHTEYIGLARRISVELPTESWAEEALNNLATHYILVDDDEKADQVFREMYEKHPRGRYAERAAWKAGWWAFRTGRHEQTVKYFERAAVDFPRSDYRPSWIYWAGRAHEALGQRALAEARFLLTANDYQNWYYGRLALSRLNDRRPEARVLSEEAQAPSPPPNELTIRALLEIGRYQDALNELAYARRLWGDSSMLQATTAWTSQQLAPSKTGSERFNLMRGGINTMRRAYPQFMAAGGENLPRGVQTVIFPLVYSDLIAKYSAENNVDPYLVAALMAQESSFVPDIRSSAGAVGLMQLMAPTARRYARTLKLTYSAALLRNPEANVRMGTAYLADKIREFGAVHLALASYNAGESPVKEWMAERPRIEREEFIDDIPYPETQTYVKRILGTISDYRRLYPTAFDQGKPRSNP